VQAARVPALQASVPAARGRVERAVAGLPVLAVAVSSRVAPLWPGAAESAVRAAGPVQVEAAVRVRAELAEQRVRPVVRAVRVAVDRKPNR
jgi:hypothetical protein